MDDYLLTARAITQAQRMAQALERAGIRAAVQRLPTGLSTQGCANAVRVGAKDFPEAVYAARRAGVGPLKIYGHDSRGYREVTV